MGPFELMDLTGIEIGYHAKLARYATSDDPRDRPSRTVTALVERGELGRKTGNGFYTYDDEGHRHPPTPKTKRIRDDHPATTTCSMRSCPTMPAPCGTGSGPSSTPSCCRSSTTIGTGPSSRSSWCRRSPSLGIVGTIIEGYGCPGLSRLAAGMVTREMSRGDGSINTFIGVQSGLSMGSIGLLGSEEQKQRWLPGMAALDKVGAFGLTEPGHGSDSVRLETTARRERDHWVLNGTKRWIGNASFADVVVIWARDEDDGRVKAFVVEKNDDGTYPDGYTTELITGKIGKRAVWQPDVLLHDVRVPADNKLAGAHSFHDATRVLTATRSGAAWESPGPRHRRLRDRAGVRAGTRSSSASPSPATSSSSTSWPTCWPTSPACSCTASGSRNSRRQAG